MGIVDSYDQLSAWAFLNGSSALTTASVVLIAMLATRRYRTAVALSACACLFIMYELWTNVWCHHGRACGMAMFAGAFGLETGICDQPVCAPCCRRFADSAILLNGNVVAQVS